MPTNTRLDVYIHQENRPYLDRLRQQALRSGVTLNSLVNQAIRDMVDRVCTEDPQSKGKAAVG